MRNTVLTILFLIVAPEISFGQTTLFGGIGRGGGSDRGELITIDQTNAAGTFIGTGATDPDVGLTGLAFDASGDLFALDDQRATLPAARGASHPAAQHAHPAPSTHRCAGRVDRHDTTLGRHASRHQ